MSEKRYDAAVGNLLFHAERLLNECNHLPEANCTHKRKLEDACERLRRYYMTPRLYEKPK